MSDGGPALESRTVNWGGPVYGCPHSKGPIFWGQQYLLWGLKSKVYEDLPGCLKPPRN